MIDYGKLKKSLTHLILQYRNYTSLAERAGLLEIDREAVAESVIQRFEVCYDCLWKLLKRYLGEQLGIAELPNSPKPLLRIAFENRLFPSIEQWLRYADARTGTAHDYSGDKAGETLKLAGPFINDAIALYQIMAGEPWT
ncbi:nucleotidyltransferase substrate binding-like protein [Treponema primitia ZAS-2]|uniref:Nucleotidyltransferase substrate binding-like protein n=1 Tax=Treponema primitia (strain ATCC BAA-887 / DSM 12427 / ZAS-2) TaxID=545694 RepID=F5YJ71_TREPZ|nr:nucleotidyltransferase substrate binding protein [Treponema primitia]AEF84992.1 nucleotidyltransferase substrate binding-like protein [Treponema primitia ZAS-2]